MSATENIARVGDPMPRLGAVSHHNGYEIAVSWQAGPRAGKTDIVDLAPVVLAYKVYRPLRDNPKLFKALHRSDGGAAIVWNDDIDMPATTVEWLAEETMTPDDFRAWLKRQKLTFDSAAAQLGISRRLVAYYAKQRQVPRYIALACRYLDHQQATPTELGDTVLSRQEYYISEGLLTRLFSGRQKHVPAGLLELFSDLLGKRKRLRAPLPPADVTRKLDQIIAELPPAQQAQVLALSALIERERKRL